MVAVDSQVGGRGHVARIALENLCFVSLNIGAESGSLLAFYGLPEKKERKKKKKRKKNNNHGW
jgi:hypothetical protein